MYNNLDCKDDIINSKRFEAILEAIPSAVAVVNVNNGKIIYINKHTMEIFGINKINQKLEFQTTMLKIAISHVLEYGHGIRNKALTIEKADDIKIPINVSSTPIINNEGIVTEVVLIFEDMTKHNEDEDKLRFIKSNLEQEVSSLKKLHNISTKLNQQKDLKTICNEILIAAIELSHADMGNIQLLNEEDKKLDIYVHYGFDEPFLSYFNKSSKGFNAWGIALEEELRVCVEDVSQSTLFAGPHDLNVLADAGVKSVQSTPLITSTGKVLGILSTHYKERHIFIDRELRMLDMLAHQAADSIERTKMVEVLKQSRNILRDTMKTQDELYANVSHELKTPINVIYSANQMLDMYLKEDYFDREKFYSYNKSIRQNCYRLIKLINNIVDLSKSKTGFLKPRYVNVNIVEVIESIVQSVAEYVKTKQLKILFDTDIEEKFMACDVAMVERILLNLISNAIKYSNLDSAIIINVIDKKDNLEIDVIDSGSGIEKEHLDKLFKKYYKIDKSFSRNAEGSGIGLSLVKSIVEILEGSISVESEIGKGSTFKVLLPVKIVDEINDEYKRNSNKIEMLNIEFSDIYE